MPKLLTRIVVCLLVACLVVDPTTVSAFTNPLSPRGWERVGVRGDVVAQNRFAEEALEQPLVLYPLRDILHNRFKARATRLIHVPLSEHPLFNQLNERLNAFFEKYPVFYSWYGVFANGNNPQFARHTNPKRGSRKTSAAAPSEKEKKELRTEWMKLVRKKLREAGVRVPRSIAITSQESIEPILEKFIYDSGLDGFEFVVRPMSGGRDKIVRIYHPGEWMIAARHARAILETGENVWVQEYVTPHHGRGHKYGIIRVSTFRVGKSRHIVSAQGVPIKRLSAKPTFPLQYNTPLLTTSNQKTRIISLEKLLERWRVLSWGEAAKAIEDTVLETCAVLESELVDRVDVDVIDDGEKTWVYSVRNRAPSQKRGRKKFIAVPDKGTGGASITYWALRAVGKPHEEAKKPGMQGLAFEIPVILAGAWFLDPLTFLGWLTLFYILHQILRFIVHLRRNTGGPPVAIVAEAQAGVFLLYAAMAKYHPHSVPHFLLAASVNVLVDYLLSYFAPLFVQINPLANAPPASKLVTFKDVEQFVIAINPYLQEAFGNYLSKVITEYPGVCDYASGIAKDLLLKRFGNRIQVEYVAGRRYGLTHHWLELVIERERYFLSFSEGQFTMWQDPELRMMQTSDLHHFARLYNAKGFGRACFQKIVGPQFYSDYHLEPTAEVFTPPDYLSKEIMELTQRIEHSLAEKSNVGEAFQNSAGIEDFRWSPQSDSDWVQLFIATGYPNEASALGHRALPGLQQIAESTQWPVRKKHLAEAVIYEIQSSAAARRPPPNADAEKHHHVSRNPAAPMLWPPDHAHRSGKYGRSDNPFDDKALPISTLAKTPNVMLSGPTAGGVSGDQLLRWVKEVHIGDRTVEMLAAYFAKVGVLPQQLRLVLNALGAHYISAFEAEFRWLLPDVDLLSPWKNQRLQVQQALSQVESELGIPRVKDSISFSAQIGLIINKLIKTQWTIKTEEERENAIQLARQTISQLNGVILPQLIALNDPDAYALPRAGHWLAAELMKHSSHEKRIIENVRWLSNVSVEGSALFFAMIGPHLRRNFVRKVDRLDFQIQTSLLAGFAPALDELLKEMKVNPDDVELAAEAKAYASALLNGLMLYPSSAKDPLQRTLPTYEFYYRNLQDSLRKSTGLDLGGILAESHRRFRDVFSPGGPKDFLLFKNESYGNEEVARLRALNNTYRHPLSMPSLWEVITGASIGTSYRHAVAVKLTPQERERLSIIYSFLLQRESVAAPKTPPIKADIFSPQMDGREVWDLEYRRGDFVADKLNRLQNSINRDDSRVGKLAPSPAAREEFPGRALSEQDVRKLKSGDRVFLGNRIVVIDGPGRIQNLVVMQAHYEVTGTKVSLSVREGAEETGFYMLADELPGLKKRSATTPTVTIWIGRRKFNSRGSTVGEALSELGDRPGFKVSTLGKTLFTETGFLRTRLPIEVQRYSGAKLKKGTLDSKLQHNSIVRLRLAESRRAATPPSKSDRRLPMMLPPFVAHHVSSSAVALKWLPIHFHNWSGLALFVVLLLACIAAPLCIKYLNPNYYRLREKYRKYPTIKMSFWRMKASVMAFGVFRTEVNYKKVLETALPTLANHSLGMWNFGEFEAIRLARLDRMGGFDKGFVLLKEFNPETGLMENITPRLVRDYSIDSREEEIKAYEKEHGVTVERGNWYRVVSDLGDFKSVLRQKMKEETQELGEVVFNKEKLKENLKEEFEEKFKEMFFTRVANLDQAMRKLRELEGAPPASRGGEPSTPHNQPTEKQNSQSGAERLLRRAA